MDHRPCLRALLAGTLLALALPAQDAAAGDPDPGEPLTFAPEAPDLLPLTPERDASFHARKRLRRAGSKTWVQEHLRPDKSGIRYREEFEWSGRALDFRASGPVVKGSPGLRLELRGLRFHRYPVRLRAIGAKTRQQLEIEFRF